MFDFIQTFDWSVLHGIRNVLVCPALDFLMPKITLLGNGGAIWIVTGILLLFFKKYRRYGITLLLALGCGALVGNICLKPLIARARPCWIENIQLLIAVPHDCSFPSGHTGCAACAMLAILLPTVCKRLRGKERLCLIAGAVWTAVVAFSRLMMGAHFLTDVTAATLLTLGVSVLGIWLFYFNGRFFRMIWGLVSEPSSNNKNSET